MGLMQRAHDVLRGAERTRPHLRHVSSSADNDALLAMTPHRQPTTPGAVQRIQQSHGNQFVQRLIQRQSTDSESDCIGGCG